MDLGSALTIEGLLQKQSPNIIKIFQTRYFAIRGKGQYLVWFKKKPVSPDQQPKGILNIDTISQVIEDEDQQRLFSIVYKERTFNFRAQSAAVKQRWVNSLRTIINHYQKFNKNKIKLVDEGAQSWKWKSNNNQPISQQIRLENEQAILQDSQNSIGKKSDAFLTLITKQKSLFQIEKCITYGFYMKKKMLTSSQRWYFLASGVNLKDQKDEDLYSVTQDFLESLNPQKQKKQQKKTEKKYDDSSSEDDIKPQKQSKNLKNLQPTKNLRINVLFQFDIETRQVKNVYELIDIVSFEMKTSQQPFQLKIVYEQVINQQEEQIKQNQIVLTSNFLIEIKKLYNAIKIINDKYNIQKQRQVRNANKSKRYPAKKWRYVNQEQWRIPQEKASLYVLLNKNFFRINLLTINLQDMISNSKEPITVVASSPTKQQKDKQKQKEKKQDVLLIKYKKQNQQFQIYIQFDKTQTLQKLIKKLNKNIKKMKQKHKEQQQALKIINRKQQQKKANQTTYLIDKRIRQTNSSIKVNFYQLMDREVIQEKKEQNNNKNQGFFDKFMNMFCGGNAGLDLSIN